ncbi:MAG: tRNA lysidine(34) synthetase TilS [Rhodothermales bacterium]|nr:tRNA lysidine(34) synthetase TilS [Rhodothermales bacterium]
MTSMSLVDRVAECLADRDAPVTAPIVLGLSGGVDSTTLLHVLSTLEYKPVAVHVNYGLRGHESTADEAFCAELCTRLELTLRVFHPDESEVHVSGKSLQESARDYRYDAFHVTAQEVGAKHVLLAHHADDSAETLLLNLFRGAGLEGLTGIPASRPISPESDVRVVRPMLGLRRSEIEAYARREGLGWREDASNLDPTYGRGIIRTKIAPIIKDEFGDAALANVARSAALVRGYVQAEHSSLVNAVFRGSVSGRKSLSVRVLTELESVWRDRIIAEALRQWVPEASVDRYAIDSIASLLEGQTGRKTEVGTCLIIRDRERLVFLDSETKNDSKSESKYLDANGHVRIGPFHILSHVLHDAPNSLDTPGNLFAYLDRRAFPVTVRRWKAGDKMVLAGSKKTKKVSDILTDARTPNVGRGDRLIVETAAGIVWIPGAARSDIHKIGPETSEVVLLTYIEETPYQESSA